MTIITAVCSEKETFLGFNNGVVLGETAVNGVSLPWLRFGCWAIGITGMSIVQETIVSNLNRDLDGKQPTEVMQEIRVLLFDNYIGRKGDDDVSSLFGFSGILARNSRQFWDVSPCLSLTAMESRKLWAQGCGADYALGAAHAAAKINNHISERSLSEISVSAAVSLDLYCPGDACVIEFQELEDLSA